MGKHRLEAVLEELVGSQVFLTYVSQAREENLVIGTLKAVDDDVIEIEDIHGQTVWINRSMNALTAVKLVKKKRKSKRERKRKMEAKMKA